MREELQSALKSRFRCALIRVRNTKHITQEEMAALLEISPRAYADLESGRSCCSAATLLMFLRLFCPGDHPFLAELFAAVEEEDGAPGAQL